jgi:hypothetical protein
LELRELERPRKRYKKCVANYKIPTCVVCAVVLEPTSEFARCELDSHADTCISVASFVMIEDSDRTVIVSAYAPEIEPLNDKWVYLGVNAIE